MASQATGVQRIVRWTAIGMIAALILTIVLARPQQIIGVLAEEGAQVEEALGKAALDKTDRMASSAYYRMLIRSGIYASCYHLLIPTRAQQANDPVNWGRANGILIWARDRVNVLFILLFLLFERAALLLMWLPSTGFIAGAAALTGWYMRKIKQGNFAFASPTLHRYGIGILAITAMLSPLMMMLPWPMPPLAFPIALLVAAFMIMLIIANVAKRI